MGDRTPPAVRKRIVAMYLAGEPVTEIARVTGSGAIYSVLRQEGHEPSRVGRLRDPVVRADREQQLLACLKLAAADLDIEVLGIRDYRAWRETSTAPAPAETAAARLFGTWAKAVDAAGLRTFTARSEHDQWDQTAVIGWLRDAAGTSVELSRAGYEQWRLTHDSTAASAVHIHRRFGWSHMIVEAGLARPTVKPAFCRDDMIGALRSGGRRPLHQHGSLSRVAQRPV